MVSNSYKSRQADAGRALDRDTKDLLDEFEKGQKQKIIALMRKVSAKEFKKTKARLNREGGFARVVAKSNAFVTKIEASPNQKDYGTIFFGLTQKVRSDAEAGRTKLIDDIAALYAFGKQNFAPIGSGDGKHQFPHSPTKWRDRGFVYSGGFPGAKRIKSAIKGGKSVSRAGSLGSFGTKLKIGYRHPDIPPADEFLPEAERKILQALEAEIPDAIRKAWEKSGKKRKR